MPFGLFVGGTEGVSVALVIALASPILSLIGIVIASRTGLLGKLVEQRTTLSLGLATAEVQRDTAVIQEVFERLEKVEHEKKECGDELSKERRERETEVAGLNSDLNAVWLTVEMMLMLRPELEAQVEETRHRMEQRRESQRIKARLRASGEIHVTRDTNYVEPVEGKD